MTDIRVDSVTSPRNGRPTFGEIAQEEFWIVARSYFALIYGMVVVLRQLLRTVRRVDERALTMAAQKHDDRMMPAE